MKTAIKYLICFFAGFFVTAMVTYLLTEEVDFSGPFVVAITSIVVIYFDSRRQKSPE